MSRLEWLKSRRNGIGASDAPKVLGLSPWGNALTVYAAKVSPAVAEPMTGPQEWGHRHEPSMAAAVMDHHGWKLDKVPTFRHAEYDWLTASPDRVNDIGELIEFKTTSRGEGWGEPETADIPEQYWVQVQHQLAVAASHNPDVRTCWVFVLVSGNDFRRYRVDRDDDYLPTVYAPLRQFWTCVEERTPPEPDWTHPATVAALNRLYTPKPGTAVDLGTAAELLADEYAAAVAEEKAAAERKAEVKAHLIAALGEFETGFLSDGRRITRKTVERAEYTVKASSYVDFRVLKAKGQK